MRLVKSEQFRNRNAESLGQSVESLEGEILLTVLDALIVFVLKAEPAHTFLLQSTGKA